MKSNSKKYRKKKIDKAIRNNFEGSITFGNTSSCNIVEYLFAYKLAIDNHR